MQLRVVNQLIISCLFSWFTISIFVNRNRKIAFRYSEDRANEVGEHTTVFSSETMGFCEIQESYAFHELDGGDKDCFT